MSDAYTTEELNKMVEQGVLAPNDVVDVLNMDNQTALLFIQQKKRAYDRGGW